MKPNESAKKKKRHKQVLLIIDMLNTLDFPEGKALAKASLPVARNIAELKKRLRKKKIPAIYVNDNFGMWQSDWKRIYDVCAAEGSTGRELALLLKPDEEDFFITKPRHSAFYSTNLQVLLEDFQTDSLILTGIAGNICVLFTANDAHMRDYEIWVPANCIASNTKADNNYALRQLKEVLKIKTTSA